MGLKIVSRETEGQQMAIAKNHDLMYEVIENMKSMARVIDDQSNIVYMNRKMREEFGDNTGKKCYNLLCRDQKCLECISVPCDNTESDRSVDVCLGNKHYRIISSPAIVDVENNYAVEIFQDITDQKNLEEEFLRHYEKLKGDISFAKQIQRKALPEDGTYWGALRLYAAYAPSEELGGDLFDLVNIDDDNCIFYIADVSGHGVRSSLLTIFLRQVIRGMKAAAIDPITLIEELIKSYNDLNLDKEQYISVLCGIYNRKTRGLIFVNAGHNCPPIVLENTENGEPILTEIEVKGMPICSLLTRPNHEIRMLQMEKGDRILLYTDGILEACEPLKNMEFGIERLKQLLRKRGNKDGKQLVTSLIDEAKEYAGSSPTDDMAAVLLEVL
jgi:sigma-B regulation protein RsbU (phosphoserine phosphatase)